MIKNLTEFNLESLVSGLKLDRSPFQLVPSSSTSQNINNLICCNQNHIFVFIEQIGAFLTIHVATSKQPPQTNADRSIQVPNILLLLNLFVCLAKR